METAVALAISHLKNAFGNVDVKNMRRDDFKLKMIKYLSSFENNLIDYKTKLHTLTSSWMTVRNYMRASNLIYDSDGSDTDDSSPVEFDILTNSWITSAKTQLELDRKIAIWNADELITEEERQKKKQEKRRGKKKRKNERKKQVKRENDECKSENTTSSAYSETDDLSSILDSTRDLEDGTEVESNSLLNMKRNESSGVSDESSLKLLDSKTASGYTYGRQGNFRAEMGQFEEAIKCYTNAIHLLTNDSKLYGNRSCCFEKLEKYDKALDDAVKAIELDPKLPMNYFRKGLALSGLKRYREAEKAFKEVLSRDPQCCFPLRELMLLRKSELVDMGFDEKKSYSAACMYKTVEDAINALIENKILDDPLDEIYMSEDDDKDDHYDFEEVRNSIVRDSAKDAVTKEPTIHMPSLMRSSDCTVWVGNILTTVEDSQLEDLFSKRCGPVRSLRVFREKVKDNCHCGFIDFFDSLNVPKAIAELNGYNLDGKCLILRIPHKTNFTEDGAFKNKDESQNKLPRFAHLPVPINGECFYWRVTGYCKNGNKCGFKHIPEHKSIEKK
ncbi:tetratricopeptide repeat domain 31 [Chamberlinius hualienensis]